ncbi:MAG: MaoC family dehydratase N-terminal domain-containing protein [Euryarchaeota archaeon]|nr:MaoC family dehydratase N-terminal domain-containing protein [Euryarchaeota archaeon]
MALYFEDLKVGDKFTTARRTVTEADITAFAGLSGDFHPLHTDEEYAKKGPFKGRIAHGMLTLSIASGLKVRQGLFTDTLIAFLGMEGLRFTAPVRIGDTIHVETEVLEKRRTSDGKRGVAKTRSLIKNQKGETVAEETTAFMVKLKETGGGKR